MDGQDMFNLDITDGIKSEKPSNAFGDLAVPRRTGSLSKKNKDEESFKLDLQGPHFEYNPSDSVSIDTKNNLRGQSTPLK